MRSKLLTIIGVVSFVAFVAIALPSTANAQEAEVQQKTETSEAKQDENTNDSYTYTAQTGDSYSVLARKAVQSYGIESNTNLSGAQIIFTETNLTIAAGSPVLEVGEKVAMSKSTVQEWVKNAQKLSDAEEAAWNYYVPFVNFDTRKNGE